MIKLETRTRPFNPFINAGAITVASCIEERIQKRDLDGSSPTSGICATMRSICLNDNVYLSEKSTGDRNRALAYYLKASGILAGDVEDCLDFYVRMCSVDVTALDIANLSAVLANHGTNPFTGETLIEPSCAKALRALMLTCGMYDGSGRFAMKVGFPAKSGVGGGIAAVVVDQIGIGVYGPALDEKGNSIGGIKILEYLAKKLTAVFLNG
ncbi:MAG: glutaminase [Blautia marasmi]